MTEIYDKLIPYEERCKGCGVCSVACPNKSIDIGFNSLGEYQPHVDLGSCNNCGRCKAVCPMDNKETKHRIDLIGDFSKFYVAHSSNRDTRNNCSSGGVVTQILIHLMNKKEIDKAVCVGFKGGNPPYFTSKICKTVDQIFNSRGSKYYPVEYSDVLEYIKQNEGNYALVCLPCVATAVRRLQKLDKRFKRIKYIICLTCGHNKTAHYIDFIMKFYKLISPYKHISFRNKGRFPFSNYAYKIIDKFGTILEQNFKNGFINKLWCGYYFAQKACLNCKDLFGLDGDVSCMDAWLYPYNKSRGGYNFILTKPEFSGIIESNPNVLYKEVDLQDIISSQEAIFDRKSKGYIPGKFLKNVELSEKYVENKEAGAILKNLAKTEIEEGSTILTYRTRYKNKLQKIKEYIKGEIGYYENLIGR